MIYEKETALIRGGLFEVQNEIGLGHHEEIYHQAMIIWLEQQQIPYISKAPHPLFLGDTVAHTLYPDLVVWDKLTIELKSVPRQLREPEHVQIFNYLKRRNDKLGLLVNMGLDRVHIERIAYDPPVSLKTEDWNAWDQRITGSNRDVGLKLRKTLENIYAQHQTGYGSEVVEKVIQFALHKQNLEFIQSPRGTSTFRDKVLGTTPFDCLLIEGSMVLVFTALFDNNTFNVSRGLSFMKSLNIPWGIAANFGKKDVQINALAL